MGDLFDDISNFWQPPSYDNQFALSYVKVDSNGPVNPPEQGQLNTIDGRSAQAICSHAHPQLEVEPGEPGCRAGIPAAADRPVRLDLVHQAFCRIAREEEFEFHLGDLTLDAYYRTLAFLTDQFGPLPSYTWDFVSMLTEAGCGVGARDPVKYMRLLTRACDEVKQGLDETQAAADQP
jgi:hypothetical protein